MRSSVLVILLTMISGCSDAISFLALGQVLTAAMTGNTVFLGLALVHAPNLEVMGYVEALGGFMIGVAFGACILYPQRKQSGMNWHVLSAMGVQLLGLVTFFALVMLNPSIPNVVFILILSCSMGIQGVTARRIGVNGVPTTVITSTTTGFVETFVWGAIGMFEGSTKAKADETLKLTINSSMLIWAIDIVVYGIGAAVCGAIEMHWHLYAIILPMGILFVVLVWCILAQVRVRSRMTHEAQTAS